MIASLLLALRWALGVLWVAAGAAKIRDVRSVSTSIRNYAVLPGGLVEPLAKFLPTAEIVLGVALVAGVFPEVTGWVALAACLTLAGAMTWNLARGRSFDCGCGLTSDTPISWLLVGRNVALAALSALVALGPSGTLAVLRGSSRVPVDAPSTTTLVAIPMMVLLVATTTRLLAKAQPLWLLRAERPPTGVPAAAERGLSLVHVDGRNTNHREAD